MEYTEVLYEVVDHVATIWLNRPDRFNAATFDMGDELQAAVREADADPKVRCVVITGKGKGFCSGDDIEAAWGDPRMEAEMARLADPRPRVTPEIEVILDLSKPTIAAVNGVAFGVGMDMALVCDMRIASEEARFSQRFVKLGLNADVIGLWLLPRLVGPAKAAELLFSGATIDATEAERIGIVSQVVPGDELLPTVYELAGRIAANPPLAVSHIKEGLRRGVGLGRDELRTLAAYSHTSLARLFASEDHSEAVQAFLQKREPEFTGR